MLKNTILLIFIFLSLTHFSFSQNADSSKNTTQFSGSVSVTNNGISIVPSFSLGKPAAAFNFSMGKNRFSFEPDLRFSLAGKPWSFLFWFRYHLIKKDKFTVNIGAHPALNFREQTVVLNGATKKAMITRRYLAAELSPNYAIGKKVNVGMYYLFSKGLDDGTINTTHFITFNTSVSNIKLSKQIFMRLAPQVYYLKLDAEDGYFFSSSISFNKKNFPIAVSALMNKIIHTNISSSKNFIWNASLTYSFNHKYIKI